MEMALAIVVAAVAAIVAVNAIAPRVRVAAPLLLVVLGVGVSLIPGVPHLEVEPEIILLGVIPPLLYSAAVSLPAMEFRRDFASISGLSVVLVLLSSVLMGLFFWAVLPEIGLPLAIALGAVVSPTDAVAVQIIKKLGVSPRVVTVLEGESMLNDATALVLVRTAVAAAGAGMTFGEALWDFSSAVVLAVVIGLVAGEANIRLRRAVPGAASSTALSFVAPWAAAVPAEALGASGLVAAVVAGLVTGVRAPRFLRPEDRISERANWKTAELILEGAVFLVLGLELIGLVEDVIETHGSLWFAVGLGLAALALALAIRAGYIAPLVMVARRRVERAHARHDQAKERAEGAGDRLDTRALAKVNRRLEVHSADVQYLENRPLRWREGTVLVWAGMRGAITLAAAQTLPADTPLRSTLVLIAFVVAAGSLLGQGVSLPWLAKAVGVAGESEHDERERQELRDLLLAEATTVLDAPDLARPKGGAYDPEVIAAVRRAVVHASDEESEGEDLGDQFLELRLAVIAAQRSRLLATRAVGTYGSHALGAALRVLDADQISTQLRRDEPDEGD
ncbi:cation:proton antiporter [Demequina lignilytica]|uniref:Sodium:proton antiporter n=1 Tax=Demequina lignilytica TaxID=3051663 RepID=A0AB35MJH6_9MICO|nr:sodium:proton antiporter [Demequina sp. SYSU T0a273]MDN4483790.1 sodium:proton antiporter [Demequina sp. SYSU T0a273]